MTTETRDDLVCSLSQFTGTENHYRHWTRRIVHTDGVQYLAETAGAYWLVDLIASHQTPRLRAEEFQVWTLTVDHSDPRPRYMAIAECRADTDAPILARQKIEYTDFPLDEIKLYLCDGVLMLPSEY